MNNINKLIIRGLVKEAGVKAEASKFFDAAKKHVADNSDIYKRVGIDAGSGLGAGILYELITRLSGKNPTWTGRGLSALGGVAAAEAGQALADNSKKETERRARRRSIDSQLLSLQADEERKGNFYRQRDRDLTTVIDDIQNKKEWVKNFLKALPKDLMRAYKIK